MHPSILFRSASKRAALYAARQVSPPERVRLFRSNGESWTAVALNPTKSSHLPCRHYEEGFQGSSRHYQDHAFPGDEPKARNEAARAGPELLSSPGQYGTMPCRGYSPTLRRSKSDTSWTTRCPPSRLRLRSRARSQRNVKSGRPAATRLHGSKFCY